MAPPAFSVIVPAFNAAATIAATLQSIGRQTRTDYEVIVVDDGSTDGSADVARAHLNERGTVLSQANGGLPVARNAGIARARGRWIALLDSDDLWLPTYLERMGALLERSPDAGLACCSAWIWAEGTRRVARDAVFYGDTVVTQGTRPREFFFTLMGAVNPIYGGACIPKAVFDDLGGFDERLRASEDWQMWTRIVASGRPVVATQERLAVYRRRAGQMTADPRRMYAGKRDAIASLLELPGLDAEQRAALERRLAEATVAAETGITDPAWRRAASLALRPVRTIREYRLRPPAELVAAFPELFARPHA